MINDVKSERSARDGFKVLFELQYLESICRYKVQI